ASGVKHHTMLMTLILDGNRFGNAGFKSLMDGGLFENTSLTNLDLSYHTITGATFCEIAAVYKQHPSLITFNCGSGVLEDAELLKALMSGGVLHNPFLISLHLYLAAITATPTL